MGKGVVIGLEKIVGKLNDLSKQIQTDLDRVIAEGANDVVNLSRSLTPVDEGKLRNSTTAYRMDTAAYAIVNTQFYAPYIEFGTGPKVYVPPGYEQIAAEAKAMPKRGNFQEFVKNLTEWVKRKGLTGTYSVKTRRRTGNKQKNAKQDERLARYLAIKILREGIEPKRFFFRAWEAHKPKILADIEKVVNTKR